MALTLLMLVLAAFSDVRRNSFVQYDDPSYVTENPVVLRGLSIDGLKWAFTTGHAANWHPLTWLSHMLDVELFGTNAGAHHLSNLLLHAASTLVLGGVLQQLTGMVWPSFITAALFAVHPLHVESVAWIAERKDVLSAFFMFLTIGFYSRYVRRPSAGSMAIVVAFFTMGILAKPMVVTGPFVLLLLDWWPLGRWSLQLPMSGTRPSGSLTFSMLAQEKLPLFALSVASSVATYLVQKAGGAMDLSEVITFPSRLLNAWLSYADYLSKTLWPARLAIFYPHPGGSVSVMGALAAALLLIVITWAVLRASMRLPYLMTGWLWYLGTLVPVIGLVQVGSQGMADRYSYIPLTGLFLAFAWGVAEITRFRRRVRLTVSLAVLAALGALVLVTRVQVENWRTSLALFSHAAAVVEGNWLAHVNLGALLEREGLLAEAEGQLKEAIRLHPKSAEARLNLGRTLYRQGRRQEAESFYRSAIDLAPNLAEARNNLGRLLLDQGLNEEALTHLKAAVSVKPDFVEARNNLGIALMHAGRLEESKEQYAAVLRLDPRHADALNNMGWLSAQARDYQKAIHWYGEALRANPRHRQALNNIAAALTAVGRYEEGAAYYRQSMRMSVLSEGR